MTTLKVELENINENQAIIIDGKDRTVLCVATLNELYQRSGSTEWIPNGKVSKAILLAGDIWLMRIPSKEGGTYEWIKFSPKNYSSNLREFYKGGDNPESFGPARKFAKSKQTAEVIYSLFDKEWQVVDIGAFSIQGSKSNEYLKEGDRMHFVTSKCKDGSWLLYLDARHGEAKGTGGAFIGSSFQPEVEIQSIL